MPFLGVEPVQEFASVAKQTITGDGSTAYTLTHSVGSANDLAVFVNNVRQEPTTAYSASGSTITFTEAIASTDSCYVMYIARTFQTVVPEDNSINADQISYPLTNFSSTGIDDNADTTAITIDSSERVSIGTSSAEAKLHVNAAGGGTLRLSDVSASSDGDQIGGIAAAAGSGTFYSGINFFRHDSNDGEIRFRTKVNNSNTDVMTIVDGRAGIGTTDPAHELHIAGTEPNIRLETGGTPGALYGLEITNGSTVDGYFRSRGATGETQIGSGRSSGWGGHLTFYTDSSEHMRINSSGSVGIGTSDPTDRLHISVGSSGASAHSYTDLLLESSSHTAIQISGPNTAEQAIWFADPQASTAGGIMYYHPNNSLTFRTAGNNRMVIDGSGYVTKPNTPAFSYGSYQNHDVTTTGTQTVSTSNAFDNSSQLSLNYNNGGHFVPSTGRFTAPVAGIYRFDWRCGLAEHNSGYFWWYIYKNSTAIAYWQSSQGMSSGSDDIALASLHVYVNLAANDYVEVKWANNYVSGKIYYPHFSGALVA